MFTPIREPGPSGGVSRPRRIRARIEPSPAPADHRLRGIFLTNDNVTLSLPAVPDFVRLARLTVASLATKVGFTYDEVEDLRIAVGEACSLLIEPAGRDGSLTLVFAPSDDGLEVAVSGEFADDQGAGDGGDLSAQILDAVVDWYEFSAADGRVRLRKAVSGG